MSRFHTLAALALSCPMVAADTLAPIVVEANVGEEYSQSQTGDVVLEEYTGSHQRIERAQLQQAGASLGQLLASETGVQHSQAGAQGSYASITVRGASSAQSPIYWDGMLLNGAANPAVDLSDLELLNLDAVDIYRGTAPVQLGAGGIGGAVELRSPQSEGTHQRLRLHAGSHGNKGLQLGASSGTKTWQFDGVLSLRQADNRFRFNNDNGTPLNSGDDQRQHRHNAQFERLSLLSKLSFFAADTSQYDFSLQSNRKKQGVPEWRNREDNQASYKTHSTHMQLQRRRQAQFGGDWNSRLGLYRQWRNEHYDDRLSQVGLGAQLTESHIGTTGLSGYLEHIGDSGTLALHLDARHETLKSHNQLENEHASARRNSAALTGQYSWFSENERWLLTPALRLNALEDRYQGQLRAGSNSRNSRSAGLQLGARFTASDTVTWQANIGQHHREPGFFELFGDQGLYVGNDALVAEKGINIDLSIHKRYAKGETSVAVFISHRDELIATVFNSQGVGRSVNIGKATIEGLELSATYQLSNRWQLRSNWTVQNAVNQSAQAAFINKKLPGQAKSEGSFRFTYHLNNTSLWVESTALLDKFYDSANLLAAKDQLLHNLGAAWQYGNWQINASINNLSDESTEDFNGFVKPGLSAHLSAAFHFIP